VADRGALDARGRVEVGEAEEVVRGAHVFEQAAVARLEDVERQRHAREEHERQREERQLPHPAHFFESLVHRKTVNRESPIVNRLGAARPEPSTVGGAIFKPFD
jgi:hypothetical protein